MKKKTINKDERFLLIICIFVIGFLIGYIGKPTETIEKTEYFFEKSANVFEIDENLNLITFETKDGNLWSIEDNTTNFVKGEAVTIVFNEANEIVNVY